MIRQTIRVVATLTPAVLAATAASWAADGQIRGRFTYDAIATCEKPAIRNFPVHVEGTASLSTDRSARLDMASSTSGRQKIKATLGQKVDAPGGSTTLNVVGKHTLRAVRDYPNNVFIATLTVVGKDCEMKLENRLKPGKHVYTFYSGSMISYCSRVDITHTACVAY